MHTHYLYYLCIQSAGKFSRRFEFCEYDVGNVIIIEMAQNKGSNVLESLRILNDSIYFDHDKTA